MKLRLIGIGVKRDGSKEPFTVSDKTTKAGLEGIIKRYEKVNAIVDPCNNAQAGARTSANLWRPLDMGPIFKQLKLETEDATQIDSVNMFGLSSERLRNAALISLLEDGECEFCITIFLGKKESVIRSPTLIRAKLEELKKELPEEKVTPTSGARTAEPNEGKGPYDYRS